MEHECLQPFLPSASGVWQLEPDSLLASFRRLASRLSGSSCCLGQQGVGHCDVKRKLAHRQPNKQVTTTRGRSFLTVTVY